VPLVQTGDLFGRHQVSSPAWRERLTRRIAVSYPALRHRDFTLLWIGQLLSFSGSRMQTAAILWHVSLLAAPQRKGLALGLVGASQVVPIIFFAMLSGVVADALDRRKVMLATQTVLALLAATLAALTFGGLHTLWPVYLLAALSSAASSFDGPARQALIPNLVPRQDLASAIGLNTLMFQIASVAGPTLAGLVIAGPGLAWVYAANAASFLMVIAALLVMRARPRFAEADAGPSAAITWAAAREGLRFVFAQPIVRSTMLLDFIATFFASATALLPIFAQDILRVGARGYGWLYAAPSVGAVALGLVMAHSIERIERRGAVLLWSVAAYGAATVIFGVSRNFWLTLLSLACVGAADTVSTVIRNLVRQLETPDELRGRMTGVNMVFFMGGPQLGELEAGVTAQLLGATFSVVSGGLGCLVATAVVARRSVRLRRYRREAGHAVTAG
jgi:MFS family permease